MSGPRFDASEAPRTATAEERRQIALGQIEGAQLLLGAACANLSPLVGAVSVWRRASKMYDALRLLWGACHDLRRIELEEVSR